MRDSSQEFVTIAVAQDSVEANIIKNYLADAGVQAYVADDEAISMDWVMANAYGGIKVQVAAIDVDEAREVLELKSAAGENGDVWTSVSPSASLERMPVDEEPETPQSDRAINAGRAFKAAVFGLLFWPLEAYAAFLLIKVYTSSEKLKGRARTLAKLASLLILSIVLCLGLIMLAFIRGPVTPENERRVPPRPGGMVASLRDLPHPEALVGKWDGTFMRAAAEVRISMQLDENGLVHYQEKGSAPVDCEGTWAYKSHVFLVRYDRCVEGDSPLKGKVLQLDIDEFRTNEMLMRFGVKAE